MVPTNTRALVAVLLVAATAIAPGRPAAAKEPGDLSSALVVVEGAQKVVRRSATNALDTTSVSYEVNTPYPASAVIAEIRGKLEGAGWVAMPRESISAINSSSIKALSTSAKPEVLSLTTATTLLPLDSGDSNPNTTASRFSVISESLTTGDRSVPTVSYHGR